MNLKMVSLGPGDCDLITIKALKALKSVNAICVPTKCAEHSFKRSMTHKIVKELMDEHEFDKPLIPVYAAMNFLEEDWQYQVDVLMDSLKKYESIAFVTLGDSAVFSTVYYLVDRIEQRCEETYEAIEVIPGVTSFSHASAKVKKPLCLGDSTFEIVPLLGKEVPKTTVYMRPKVGMSLDDIEIKSSFYTFENLNYKNETITPHKKDKCEKYMTLYIDFCDVQ